MTVKERIKELENGLKEFDPVTIDYGKDKVIGFANDKNGNDLVLYVTEKETVLTFGYQNAHFAPDDINSAVIHTIKYLKSEYASVEFFQKAKDLFGGSRPVENINFDTVENIANSYAMGNEKVKQGMLEFFKNNKDITVRAVTFNGEINTVREICYDGEKFSVKIIRE